MEHKVVVEYMPEQDAHALRIKINYYTAKPDKLSWKIGGFDDPIVVNQEKHYAHGGALIPVSETVAGFVRPIVENLIYKVYKEAHPDVDEIPQEHLQMLYQSVRHMFYESTKYDINDEIQAPTWPMHEGGIVNTQFIHLKESSNDAAMSFEGFKEYYNNKFVAADPTSIAQTGPVNTLRSACPALDSLVKYPKDTAREGDSDTLYYVIQHLNDTEKWTREQIADWLESLDINIEVNMEES